MIEDIFRTYHCGIHLIPWVRVGYPDIHLLFEPTWIIQAGCSNSDGLRL
jgi:hypothetical protein